MVVQKIISRTKHVLELDISDILEMNDIHIEVTDQIKLEKAYAFLVDKVIYIKSNLDERLRKFIILHELGHFFLHNEKSAYAFKTYGTSKMEMEANMFAALYLLNDVDLSDLDIPAYLISEGVPKKIAYRCHELIEENKSTLDRHPECLA